jgi:uncharacterized protein YjbI with pentapeptide repeats
LNKRRIFTGSSMAGVAFFLLVILLGVDIDTVQRIAFIGAALFALLFGGISLFLSMEAPTNKANGESNRSAESSSTSKWVAFLDRSREWWADWLGGISTELIGAVITTVLLSTLVEQVQIKNDLLAQLHSGIEANAIHAIEELRVNGWLNDDTLRGASLLGVSWSNADLHEADLREANLAYAHLENANLQAVFLQRGNLRQAILNDANLSGANLDNANLSEIDMQDAIVRDANLNEVNLFWARLHNTNFSRSTLTDAILVGTILDNGLLEQANLQSADFTGASLYHTNMIMADLANAILEAANLQGAILLDANLESVDLTDARFDETTVLPNGALWTDAVDMARFTDPSHDDFWRSTNADSPAAQ